MIRNKDESIHELNFSNIPSLWENKNLNEKWKLLFKIKQEANIAIEEKRSSKEIGSSLEAEIEIIINKKEFNLMNGLDLAEYFITSKAERIENTDDSKTKIIVKKTTGDKCPRCWKVLSGKCKRCDNVVNNQLQ